VSSLLDKDVDWSQCATTDAVWVHACQAAALSRLAYLVRSMTGDMTRQKQHMRDEWAAATAAALSAAAFWAHGHQNRGADSACSSPGAGSGGGRGSGTRQQQEGQQTQQRFMQHTAFDLGEAAALLLLPAATAGLDTLEREPVPRLLASLASHCRIDAPTLQRHVQVWQA
jgi:hypothetical protein